MDANKFGEFLKCFADDGSPMKHPPVEDVKPIITWLERQNGKLIYTNVGDFATEIGKKSVKTLLDTYARRGKARLIPKEKVEAASDNLHQRSNDRHILELALASGARLLYTADKDLMADFKNPDIINNPRGKVYSSAKNKKRLLRRDTCP